MMVTVNVDVAVLPHASDTRNVNLCSEPPDDTRLAAVVRISVQNMEGGKTTYLHECLTGWVSNV